MVRGEHSCRDSKPLGNHAHNQSPFNPWHSISSIHFLLPSLTQDSSGSYASTRPRAFPGTACPGPCGSSMPTLPTPNPARKERFVTGLIQPDDVTRVVADVAFARCGRSRIFVSDQASPSLSNCFHSSPKSMTHHLFLLPPLRARREARTS